MARRGGLTKQETSAPLDDQTVEELELAFRLFAGRNRKEDLTSDDVYEAARRLGLRDITEQDAKKMIEEGDLQGDNTIDFEEFVTMMSKKMAKTDPEHVVIEAFEKFDWKKTGSIPVEELTEALRHFGDPLNPSELKEMMEVGQQGESFSYRKFVAEMFGSKTLERK